jgi:hypothetical protein
MLCRDLCKYSHRGKQLLPNWENGIECGREWWVGEILGRQKFSKTTFVRVALIWLVSSKE